MQPRRVSLENGRNYSTSWAQGRVRLLRGRWVGDCKSLSPWVRGQEPWGPRGTLALGTWFIPKQEGDVSPWTCGQWDELSAAQAHGSEGVKDTGGGGGRHLHDSVLGLGVRELPCM